MKKWKAVGLLALFVSAPAYGQEKPKPMATVSVRLSFSVDEYDPSKPSKAVMKCVVVNDSRSAIRVPVGFDGGYVQLRSGLLSLLKSKGEKEDVKLVQVEPGHQQVVFELPLDDIFLVGKKRNPVWHWNWPRRPEPPLSPIHKYRKPGFVDQASFVVSLDLGSSTLKSEPVTLQLKEGK